MSEFRYTGKCNCGQALSLVTEAEKPYVRVTCPSCNRSPSIPRIEGTFNPDHKCDSRCTGAKGNVCRCSCGGANHGKDHGKVGVVLVTNDSQGRFMQETARRTKGWIGEEGKTIRGEVTLVSTRPVANDKYYFQFRTNDGDTIKWFVPDQYAPEWRAGWTGTIRAKVIRHENHETYGKSTVVIFVEEVE